MTTTKIEWCDRVWNPVTGCTKVSEGCRHCYAERMAKRLRGRYGYPKDDPFKVTLHSDKLAEPLHWRKPSRIFVCSMGDMFHVNVPFYFVDKVIRNIRITNQHTYLLLTKRPHFMKEYFEQIGDIDNLYLGVSVEDQKSADERIPLLLQTPAAKRFISIEPMLGPVDLNDICDGRDSHDEHHYSALECDVEPEDDYPFDGAILDWVILGGESGPGARPMHPEWVRSVRDQCQAAGVPFFFKQWGGWAPTDEDPPDIYLPPKYEPGHLYARDYTGVVPMKCVGKKAAGCLLDGREWKEFLE